MKRGDDVRSLAVTDDSSAELQRIEYLLDLKRFRDAREAIADGLGQDPQSAALFLQLCRLELLEGDPGSAVLSARQAVHFEPEWVEGYRLLAAALCANGEYIEALDVANKVVAAEPHGAYGFEQRAAILMSGASELARSRTLRTREIPQLAMADVDRGLELEPNLAALHSRKGTLLAQVGQMREARAAWEQALVLDPTNTTALRQLSDADLFDGRRLGRARRHAKTALAIDPQSKQLQKRLQRLAERRLLVPVWIFSCLFLLAFVLRTEPGRVVSGLDWVVFFAATVVTLALTWWWWRRRIDVVERQTLLGPSRLLTAVAAAVCIVILILSVAHLIWDPYPPSVPGHQASNGEVLWNIGVLPFAVIPIYWLSDAMWALYLRWLDRVIGKRLTPLKSNSHNTTPVTSDSSRGFND